VQYMAPEQVEGKTDDIDGRTDIFAFGALVYEMATGKKAFEGKSRASVIAAILEREVPPISSLQPMSPPTLDRVVKKCLAKEREKRWQSASDLHDELEWIKEGGQEAAKAASPETKPAITWRRAGVLSFAALVIGAAIASIATWTLKPSPTQPVSRVTINLPPGQRLAGLELAAIAFSPDGTQLAYVANRGGVQQLFLRDLDSLEAKPLPGTEGAVSPFFSPDGQWLGFFADQKLKKVSVTGGAPAVLAAAGANGRGGTWGRNGHIIFAPQTESGLWQVPASGGTPEVLTTLDPNKGEGSHRYPHHLPGGKAILFTVGTGGGWDEARIEALRLDTGERKVLIEGGSDARYVSSGHLTYIRAGTLMAVPFDLNRLEVTGLPVAVEEGVLPSTDNTGSAQAGFSALGWLVYVPGGGARPDERTLVWVDHKGTEQALALPPRPYRAPRVSPDGRRLVMDIDQGNKQDVWVYDISRGTLTRLTYEGSSAFPVWTPDGKKVTFQSRRGRPWNLYWKPGDGSGGEERLTTSEYGYITASWTPDGQMLAFVEVHPTTGRDIGVLSLIEERKATPFLRTPFNEVEPAFSPDGRWLAYAADESGRNEVYVQPFPGGGQKWQISTEGGSEPVWARDGRELFYRNGDKMMAVSITTQPAFRATKPELLFERHYHSLPPAVTRNYDIAPDGRRFLMVKASDQAAIVTHLNVVLNWFEELKRKVPVK
ncbi:MAG: PD40 domain-containing protein, partial [Acidobacteria bacterium]|nr:PD40 domain-containing protein [Acidobacteriota bacterium]